MRKNFTRTLLLFIVLLSASLGFGQTLRSDLWVTNGTVNSIITSGNTIYLGGNFTIVGPNLPYGAALNTTTGSPDLTYAKPNGAVSVAVADGSGGWYIGGNFTAVGGVARNNLAHINSDGTVSSWDPNANGGGVSALAISGSTVYAGGAFTTIGGQTRNRIAAIDAATGIATSWNPNASSQVNALAISGSTVYAGGTFNTIGGQVRNFIAAIDAATGIATSWNPNAGNSVSALAISGSTVYAGGTFIYIGGQTRNYIAAIDAATGLATSWNPTANSSVSALAISGSTVYAGGGFTTIGGPISGQVRNFIAAIDAATGLATSWNPTANGGGVSALAISGSTVYAGGAFTIIGGQTRNRIAAIDAATGIATSWNPNAGGGGVSGGVSALAISGSTVYTGGGFTTIGGQTRNRIAAIDAATGIATSWNPNASGGGVSALAISGSTVYAGGAFTTIGGQTRNRIAAIDASTGLATSWNPDANSNVNALAISGSTVYAGGSFTTIGGQIRNRIAAIDSATGLATSWNPDASNSVSALAISGSTVYAGGVFTTIGGQARNRIAAIDAATGLATSWNPNAGNPVSALAISGSTVYAGGSFTSIGGQTRNRIAAIDAATGFPTSWDPNADNAVNALAISGSTVYAGGGFFSIGVQPRNRIAAIDAATGLATSWNPNGNSTVSALAISGSTVYAGGAFTAMGGIGVGQFAGISIQRVAPITGSTTVCATSTTQLNDITSGGVWSSSDNTVASVNVSGLVTGISSGTATISYTVTDINNVSTSVTTVVTVNALPTATITAGSATTFCTGGSVILTASAGSSYLWSNNAITQSITVNASGNYSVTVTNANNCSATVTKTITVNDLPTLAAITGTTTACLGQTTQLSNATHGGVWSSSNGSVASVSASGLVTAIATGTATISYSVTNANNCTTVVTTIITISPLPTVSITSPNATICAGTPTTLTASGAQNYTWMPGSLTGSSVTISPTATTTYTVTGTDAASCASVFGGDWKAIVSGGDHSMAIKTNGTLWGTGANYAGQLGDGTTTQVTLFKQIGASTWTTVAAGNAHSLGIKSDGTLWAWGQNTNGQLGNATNTQSTVPVQIGTSTWTAVDGGGESSLGIKSDGTLWGWGSNTYGQVGNGTTTNTNVPVQIGTATWLKVSCGDDFSLAIKSDGTLWGWGHNNFYQLGMGTNTAVISSPVQIGTATNWASLATGQSYSLGIRTNGTLWAWGYGTEGGLGLGATGQATIPTQVGSATWLIASVNYRSSMAIKSDGTLSNWGYNGVSQLGNGNSTNINTPTQLGTSTWSNIAAGTSIQTAIRSDGTLWGWGLHNGQLGNGTTTWVTTPVQTGNSGTTITVNPSPTATITAGSATTFCSGGQVVLTASAGNSYLWSNNATTPSITVGTSGNYSVTVTNANNCSVTSAVTSVTVNASPTITITAGSATTFCSGGQVVLTASAGNSYLWSNNATTPSITVGTSGNYSVTVTNANNCSATSAATSVTVNALPTATTATTAVSCLGGSNGSITITASNGNAPYLYSKDGGSNFQTGNVFSGLTAGVYVIIVKSASNCSSVSQQVTIGTVPDVTKPVPDITSLPVLKEECSVTVSGTPTATDNCAGTITGTTTDPLIYNSQGTYTITWLYNDGHGNIQTQTQTVIVDDVTAPVPDVATLATITGECSASVMAPTATDNCAGSITGTTLDPTSYTEQGTYTITWSYDDGNGNISTQTQTVIVADVTMAVPDMANLPTVTSECAVTVITTPAAPSAPSAPSVPSAPSAPSAPASSSAPSAPAASSSAPPAAAASSAPASSSSTPPPPPAPIVTGTVIYAPTATDNCAGTIIGTTTDPLSYTEQGTHIIHWTFDDGHGNITPQNQTVIISDVTAPVADLETLPTITAECSSAEVTAPTATDNCAGTIVGTTTDALSYNTQGTHIIHWSFDDGHGNISTQDQTMIIQDVTAPVPDVATLATITGECSANVMAPTATDNCVGTITGTTLDPTSYTEQGTYTITWSFDDLHGNVSTQTQTVIVADVTIAVPDMANLPTVTSECAVTVVRTPAAASSPSAAASSPSASAPPPASAPPSAASAPSASSAPPAASSAPPAASSSAPPPAPAVTGTIIYAPTATDNCAGTIIGTTTDPLSYTEQGTYTIHWTFDDGHGNITTQNQTVIISDVTAPVADIETLPTITAECSSEEVTAPTATDNCAGTIVGTTTDAVSYNTQGTHIIHWSFDDGHGNISTQDQTVIILDVTAPVPDVSTLATITGECSANVMAPTATDNCVGAITGTTLDPTSYTEQGTYTITWSFDDLHGNVSTQTQTVIVQDITSPTIICPDNINATATSTAGAVVNYTAPVGADNCSATTARTGGPASGSTFPIGTTTVTHTVTDVAGLTAVCSFTVTVAGLAPSIHCPENIRVNNDINKCGAIVSFEATETTAIPASTITYSIVPGNFFSVGTTTVTATATNAVGTSTCTFTITVVDTQFPVLVGVPANTTVECDAAPAAAIVTATDNCSTTIPTFTQTRTDGNCANNYTLTRTWSTKDASGNTTTATQVIMIQDNKAPILSAAPADVIVECNAVPEEATLTATDNCDAAPVVAYHETRTNGSCPNSYTLTRTWTATDACGNASSKKQMITVQDTKAPILSAPPADVIVECNAVPAAATLTATDNCDAAPVVTYHETRTNGDCPNSYTLTRTWTAKDACGNASSKTQVIMVQDTKAPALTVPADISVVNDNNVCGATVRFAATATDNCSTPTITYSQNPGTVFAIGRTVVTVTAKDACGNPTVKSFTVTVTDTQFPVLVGVPANATVECDAVPAAAIVTATDNCSTSVPTFTQTRTNGDCANNYTLSRTWSTKDASGNTTTATQVITVQDTKAPVLTMPADISVPNDNNVCGATVTFAATATDNCSTPTITYSQNPGTVFAIGRTVVTVTAKDACGNLTVKSFTVTVTDTQFPVLVGVPANTTVECDAVPAAAIVTATDNCTTSVPTFTQTRTDGNCANNYTLTRTWSTKDASGNTTTATQVITVQDTQAPVLSAAPDNVTVECNAIPAAAILTATDNCSTPTVGYTQTSTQNASVNNAGYYNYMLTRTWTATDACGNSSSKVQVITVQDKTKPVIVSCPSNVTQCNDQSGNIRSFTFVATDNCSPLTTTYSITAPNGSTVYGTGNTITTGFAIGTSTINWTVKDVSGNTNSCSTIVVVKQLPDFTISSVPTSSEYTGGNNNNLYLGYGAQSTKLQITHIAISGNELLTYTYSWSGNLNGTSMLSSTTSVAPIFTPTASGYYTFTVITTNNLGCSTTRTINICITDIRVPGTGTGNSSKVYVTSSPGNSGKQKTEMINLNAVAAHLSQPGAKLGSSNQIPCFGNVAVTSVAQFSTQAVTKEKETLVSSTEEELKVTVMPNPSTTYFTLKLESKYETPVNMRVMDGRGRVVDAKSKIGANSTIQIGHNYSSGTYYAELIQGNKRKVVQLIKVRG
jgi:alpha-tubulin suppressor-like RCC1 family protein